MAKGVKRNPAKLRAATRGMALVAVMGILLVASLILVFSLKSSVLGQKIAGLRSQKMSLNEVAHTALEIVQLRIKERMNPPLQKINSGVSREDWTADTLKKGMMTDPDNGVVHSGGCPAGECWTIGGVDYHGYRFQRADSADDELPIYANNFFWEGTHNTGVFKPCTVANSCASGLDRQWSAKTLGAGPVAMNNVLNFFGKKGTSKAETKVQKLRVEVTAYDEGDGKRTVIQSDILLIATDSTNRVFASYSDAFSRMSLMSGIITGPVSLHRDTEKVQTNTSYKSDFFNFGEMGSLNWGCKTFPWTSTLSYGGPMNGCAALMTTIDHENKKYFTNMVMKGLSTNLGLAYITGTHVGATPLGEVTASEEGLTIDDADNTTGDSSSSLPDALLYRSDNQNNFLKNTIPFRTAAGGIPTSLLPDLMAEMNPSGTPELKSSGGTDCIYKSDYRSSGTNSGVKFGIDAPTSDADGATPGMSKDSIVLAPTDTCTIRVKGTYIINGDLIIAGNGLGHFEDIAGSGTKMNAAILATGNIYVLNDVRLANEPGNDGAGNNFRKPNYNASTAAAFDQLSLIANGFVVIGNLANSQTYSYLMTLASSEINYFRLDLTGSGKLDLLVPDGFRPNPATPNAALADTGAATRISAPSTAFQVRRETCTTINTAFGNDEVNCGTKIHGLLPEGSSLVTSKYKFAFGVPTIGGQQSGFGYVQNAPVAFPVVSGTFPNRNAYIAGIGATWKSDVPVDYVAAGPAISNIFKSGWIDTGYFRLFAEQGLPGTRICCNVNQYHNPDSMDPDQVNRAHKIYSKLYGVNGVIGLGSLEDKYNLPVGGQTNYDKANRGGTNLNFAFAYNSFNWNYLLLKDVNDQTRYADRCNTPPAPGAAAGQVPYINNPALHQGPHPWGIEIFGGVYGKYINILSTNGLCVYHDNRDASLGHEPIFVMTGAGYVEDPS
jgi:hypothetical protein